LALALLIHRQDDGVVRRVEVKADDVANLLGEHRVLGEFEAADHMGLHAECPPDLPDRRLADSHLARHRATAPMGAVTRNSFQGLCQHILDCLVADGPGSTAARFVGQTRHAVGREALPPLAHRLDTNAYPGGNLIVLQPFRTGQDDTGAQRVALGGFGARGDEFELLAFGIGQTDGGSRSRHAAFLLDI
jgi:hypothetical protein